MMQLTAGRCKLLCILFALVLLIGLVAGGYAEGGETAEQKTKLVRNLVFLIPIADGFTETDRGEQTGSNSQLNWVGFEDESGNRKIYAQVTSYKNVFSMKNEEIQALYEKQTETIGEDILLWKEEILLDGQYPACVVATTETVEDENGQQIQETLIRLLYFRCCNLLEMYYDICVPAAEGEKPEKEDYISLLGQTSYAVPEDREGLPEWLVTPDCFETTLSTANDAIAVASGKTLTVKADMKGQKLVRAMSSDAVKQYWLLLDAEKILQDGSWVPVDKAVASINQSGQVRTGNVSEVTPVVVVAYNQAAGYTASKILLVLPKQKQFSLSGKEAVLYVDESEPLQVTAQADPADTLLFMTDYTNVTWKLNREGYATLEVGADGTATVTPLKAGTVTLTAKDTVSGRQAQMNIRIMIPVTGLEISGPESIAPGKGATYKVTLTPEKPSNRKVTWSIDQEKSIATIGSDGRLSVRKEAPSGTVITITCQAQGSSMERIAQMQVTVE